MKRCRLGTHRTKDEMARIVMEVLSNTSTIAEICRKHNVVASAVYKWKQAFIAAGTAAMEHGRSTTEASLSREINELKGIIGEPTKIYIEGEGWVHLTGYLDLCSRKIKGHLVSRMSRTAEMIEAVDNALLCTFQDLDVNGLRIRSDNGSPLTSSGYEKHLRKLGIKHETIHAHTPEEDGHIESYFGRLKGDYTYTREFVSFEDFRKYIEWAISDYNTKRPYSSLNYMTPEEFESAILNEDFRKKWIEKEIGRYKHVELLE